MDLGLEGRRALVAGASSGLGLAIARELAREGCAVAMVARGRERLERAAGDVARATDHRALPIVGDVSGAGEAERIVHETVASLGPIDILVANAGGPPATTFATATDEQYVAAIEQNLLGSIRLARACVPSMRERKRGRVLFVSSMAAKQPLGGLLLSNTARAGLLGFAKSLANEVARDGVLVNTVLPGHFDTPRAVELARMRAERDGRPVDQLLEERARSVPLGRLGDPREFAAMVAFLASERESFVTGTAIQVDGGQVGAIV